MRVRPAHCVAAVVAAAAIGGVALGAAHARSTPEGRFLGGKADPAAVSVETGFRRPCEYDASSRTAYVPVRLEVGAHAPRTSASGSSGIVGEGWVTLHVKATVTSRRAGHATQTSAVEDIPINVGTPTRYDSVDVPLDPSLWRPPSTSCFITGWSMTSGVRFGDD